MENLYIPEVMDDVEVEGEHEEEGEQSRENDIEVGPGQHSISAFQINIVKVFSPIEH